MNQNISVDPEIVRNAMNRISNVSGLIDQGRAELPAAALVCVAVPDVAAKFQSVFELAITRVTALADATQLQLAGNAQQLWSAAEDLDAVDADLAAALSKTEAAALAVEQPLPVSGGSDIPNANSIGSTPAPSVGGTPGIR